MLGAAAAFASHGIAFNPNRIVDADPVSLVSGLGAAGWALVAVWLCAAALALSPLPDRARGLSVTLLGGVAPVLMLWAAGRAAEQWVAETSDIARTSLLWAAWVSLFASYMVIYAATAWLKPGVTRLVLTYLPVAGVAVLVFTGRLSELAVAREYAVNAQTFATELARHLAYVAGSVSVGIVVGVGLGVLTSRKPRFEPAVFGTLNVLQVVPTLAFVGMLYPLLSGLSQRFSVFDALGVRGVGWAPVLIVLSMYAIYPIARNTHAALTTLDRDVVDAARGMGMSRVRTLTDVELPLAAPVILAGIRVALVQTTAGAIVAGLVGGGGLGTFVFLGAGETATDLILLGVIPIVTLALFFDRSVIALEWAFTPRDVT